MSESTKFIYTHQINLQISYAKIAISSILCNNGNVLPQSIFYNIETMLMSCANISKLFCPQKTNSYRIQNLKDDFSAILLNFESEFPLISNRNLRDSFEHFDERIDYFIKNGIQQGKNFADCNIGTISKSGESAGFYNTNTIYMRHYDNINFIVSVVKRNSFETWEINIKELNHELDKLLKLVNEK